MPAHIEGTVEAIARLHADHRDRATKFQKIIAILISRAGRPSFLLWLAFATAGWIFFNLGCIASGSQPIDGPPFAWLELAASLLALVITVMILTTQRRDDELANHRDQLTLELAILNDHKAAKIIALLEELRRDLPTVRNRADHDAAAMATPADPQAVLDAIKSSHEDEEKATRTARDDP